MAVLNYSYFVFSGILKVNLDVQLHGVFSLPSVDMLVNIESCQQNHDKCVSTKLNYSVITLNFWWPFDEAQEGQNSRKALIRTTKS